MTATVSGYHCRHRYILPLVEGGRGCSLPIGHNLWQTLGANRKVRSRGGMLYLRSHFEWDPRPAEPSRASQPVISLHPRWQQQQAAPPSARQQPPPKPCSTHSRPWTPPTSMRGSPASCSTSPRWLVRGCAPVPLPLVAPLWLFGALAPPPLGPAPCPRHHQCRAGPARR